MIALSLKDRDRLVVLRGLLAGELTGPEAALRLGVTLRQVRRLRRRMEAEGDEAVVHRGRGRASNRRLDPSLRAKAVAKASDPLYRDFAPTLLSEHLARDPEIGPVHRSTLRLWMIEAGLWQAETRKCRHRKRRARRAAFGELVLMDTSIHDWLEARSTEPMVLIAMIDDATSRLFARFYPKECGANNRRLIVEYMERFGRPQAFYVDRASHFKVNWREKQRRDRDLDEARTLIARSLAVLNTKLIRALSPQAKGRVERLFGTLQDRLIKEMRVAGVVSIEEANRFLAEVFIPFWDSRFSVEPVSAEDVHRPLPEEAHLLALFADTETRQIREDFTFRYKNVHYQIEKSDAEAGMPKSTITIERRLDGSFAYRWKDEYLSPTRLPGPPAKPQRLPQPKPPRPGTSRPIPATHPWKRQAFLVGSRAET